MLLCLYAPGGYRVHEQRKKKGISKCGANLLYILTHYVQVGSYYGSRNNIITCHHQKACSKLVVMIISRSKALPAELDILIVDVLLLQVRTTGTPTICKTFNHASSAESALKV